MMRRLPDSAKDLHVVAFHFRGSRQNGVSLYWLSDPEVRFCSIVKCAKRVSVFQPINLLRSRGFAAPLMWLRPLQGTTQQGLPVQPVLSCSPDTEPSNPPKRIFMLTARVTAHSPKRPHGSSKGEPSNAGLSSNSRGILRPFGASAQASQLNPGLPHRVRSAHRVSHPHDGLLLA
jgi:hypothetical protein